MVVVVVVVWWWWWCGGGGGQGRFDGGVEYALISTPSVVGSQYVGRCHWLM